MINRKSVFILGLAACMAFSGLPAAQAALPEYEVKAAFLFNFAKFVQWPSETFSDPRSPIRIGVLGEDPFGDALEKIVQGQSIDDRPLVIERSRLIDDLKDCQLLFISPSEETGLARIFQNLQGRPVLTIGESQNFAQRGGVINFVKKENKIRFEINVEAAREAQLKIDSKLLQLAILVNA